MSPVGSTDSGKSFRDIPMLAAHMSGLVQVVGAAFIKKVNFEQQLRTLCSSNYNHNSSYFCVKFSLIMMECYSYRQGLSQAKSSKMIRRPKCSTFLAKQSLLSWRTAKLGEVMY